MTDPRAEPGGNGNGHSHDGDGHDGSGDDAADLIRRIAVEEVTRLAVGRISSIENSLSGFRSVSGERYESLQRDSTETRTVVAGNHTTIRENHSATIDAIDRIGTSVHGIGKRLDDFEVRVMREFAKLGQRVSLVDEHEQEITGQHQAIETIAAAVSRVEQATPHKVWSRMIALVGATSALVEKHSTLAKLAAATVVFAAQIYIAWHVTHPH